MEPQLQRCVQRYGWDKAAQYYDNSWKEQLQPAHDKLMEMANLQPGEHILESAYGTGLLTLRAGEAVEPDEEITAIDLSNSIVERNSSRIKTGWKNRNRNLG